MLFSTVILLYAIQKVCCSNAVRSAYQIQVPSTPRDLTNVSVSIGTPEIFMRTDEVQNPLRVMRSSNSAGSNDKSSYEMIHLDNSAHQLDVSLHVNELEEQIGDQGMHEDDDIDEATSASSNTA
jgi:hypothetical protein